MPELVEIKGVGPVLAKACSENGYGSVESIAAAGVVELAIVPGVSEVRARLLIGAAQFLLNGAAPLQTAIPPIAQAEPEKKRAKKSKKDNSESGKKSSKKEGNNKKKTKKNKKKKSKKKNSKKKK